MCLGEWTFLVGFPGFNDGSTLLSQLTLGGIVSLIFLLNTKWDNCLELIMGSIRIRTTFILFTAIFCLAKRSINTCWINKLMRVRMLLAAEHHRFGITQYRLRTETVSFSGSLLTGEEAGKKWEESNQGKSKYVCKLWWMVWTPGNFGRINNSVVSKVHKQII